MRLDPPGHPIHTRALAVGLAQRDDRKLDVRGYVLDLRKRGFVPVAGDLQGTGIVHHMRLRAVVDPATATLASITAEQDNVAFEPSALTGGESCRDPIDAIGALAGARLDAGFARRVGAAIGGPRGCSHLVTLAHLLGSTTAWALEHDRALHGPSPDRPAGQRVFRRDLIIDGYETPAGDGSMALAVQLADLHFSPRPEVARPMDRFAADREIRGLMMVGFPTFALTGIEMGERTRDNARFEQADWKNLDAVVAQLVGLRFGFGITNELLQRFPQPADRPLLDVLLMVAPALIQCTAALSDSWPAAYKQSVSVVGMGGLPDSCYMWRRDGALSRARSEEGGQPPSRPPSTSS